MCECTCDYFPRNAAAIVADGWRRRAAAGADYTFSSRVRASLSSLSRSWLSSPEGVPSIPRASTWCDATRCIMSRRVATEPRVRNRWKCPEWLHLWESHRTQVRAQRDSPRVFTSALNNSTDDIRACTHARTQHVSPTFTKTRGVLSRGTHRSARLLLSSKNSLVSVTPWSLGLTCRRRR